LITPGNITAEKVSKLESIAKVAYKLPAERSLFESGQLKVRQTVEITVNVIPHFVPSRILVSLHSI
jgi:hypothetical protein